MRMDFTHVQSRLFSCIEQKLQSAEEYRGEIKAHFDRLITLLIKFLTVRIDASGSRYPYLRGFREDMEAPVEGDLQADLYDFLVSSYLGVDLEKTDVASGRADIYIPAARVRFVIELKRAFDDWSQTLLEPFLVQTRAYQQTDIRLGVLGVLDLSVRSPGTPHLEACFDVVQRNLGSGDQRTVLVMRVPGNVRTPSSVR